MPQKPRVGVVFGGRSGEHEVSLISARSVMAAFDTDRYEVVPIGITRAGRWLAGDDALTRLQSEAPPTGELAALLPAPSVEGRLHQLVVRAGGFTTLAQLDVIFPVLHGPMGEDGTIQGLFELADIPYVGNGVLASAVGMDKIAFKHAMQASGIPVVEGVHFTRHALTTQLDGVVGQVEQALTYPVFCKPANMGSSVGVGKASDRSELCAALTEAARWDRRVLVERGVDAREVEVSVLGNEEIEASLAGEIVPSNEFYDFAAKYVDGDSDLLFPAPISDALMTSLREVAIAAFRAIDGAGLARVDFLLERGTDRFYLNEVNTLPGFTPISMYPKLWEASGLSYSALLDRLVELALARHAEKQALETVFHSAS